MKQSLFTLVFMALFFSCSERPIELPPFEPIVTDRVVLVEDLTGAGCNNCPEAAEFLYNLEHGQFEGQMITVGIHGSLLADPITDKSKYDFRSPEAAELELFLKPWFGKPAAAFNRTDQEDITGQLSLGMPELWEGHIANELSKPHVLELTISELSYDDSTREVEVEILAASLIDTLKGDYNVSIILVENHIIDAQKFPSETKLDYEFNHVYRMSVTETLGNSLGVDLLKNIPFQQSHSATIPTDSDHPELWNPDNMDVIAFVHNTLNKEVMQAAKVSLK